MAARWYKQLMLLQGGAAEEALEKGLGCLWAELMGGSDWLSCWATASQWVVNREHGKLGSNEDFVNTAVDKSG